MLNAKIAISNKSRTILIVCPIILLFSSLFTLKLSRHLKGLQLPEEWSLSWHQAATLAALRDPEY
jgi:hypothetical protein